MACSRIAHEAHEVGCSEDEDESEEDSFGRLIEARRALIRSRKTRRKKTRVGRDG